MAQRHLILDLTQQSKLLTARGQRNMLLVLFSFLLLLVIVCCTFGPSPLLPVALVAALTVAISGFIQPRLALFLVFTAAGLPRLLVPLPYHTMRLLEPLLFLCLLIILIQRPFLRLRLPHRLALLYLAIAIISFIHVPDISTSIYIDGADKRLYTVLLIVIAFFCGATLAEYIKDASSFLVAVLISNIPLYLIGAAQAIGPGSNGSPIVCGGLGLIFLQEEWPNTMGKSAAEVGLNVLIIDSREAVSAGEHLLNLKP